MGQLVVANDGDSGAMGYGYVSTPPRIRLSNKKVDLNQVVVFVSCPPNCLNIVIVPTVFFCSIQMSTESLQEYLNKQDGPKRPRKLLP